MRGYRIETNIKEAARGGAEAVTLSMPRVSTLEGQSATVQISKESGLRLEIDVAVKALQGNAVKLSGKLRDEPVDKTANKEARAALDFDVTALLGDNEKVVLRRHPDGSPRLWIEFKISESWQAEYQPVVHTPLPHSVQQPPVMPSAPRPAVPGGAIMMDGVKEVQPPRAEGARGLHLRHRTADTGPRIELTIGDVQAEGTRFQIGSDEDGYRIAAASNGICVKGPGVQTICTEMVLNAGLRVKSEPFNASKGQLRACCRPDHPGMVLIEWGDAQLLCSKLTFKKGDEGYSLTAGSGEFVLQTKNQTVLCKQLSINFELGNVTVNGAAAIALPK